MEENDMEAAGRREHLLVDRYPELKRTALPVIELAGRHEHWLDKDDDVRKGLRGCLDFVDFKGIVVHFAIDNLWMGCFTLDDHERLFPAAEEAIRQYESGRRAPHKGVCEETMTMAGEKIRVMIVPVKSVYLRDASDVVYFVGASDEIAGTGPHSTEMWYPAAATFREVFRQRCQNLSHRNAEYIKKTWDTCKIDENEAPMTVTLSLDLRKSTFAMDQSESRGRFARWMSTLVSSLRNIVKKHRLIFDKFTGDGVIAHFSVGDVKEDDFRVVEAVERVARCAAEMIAAVEGGLDELRRFLHYDSRLFGAGVGIGVGAAHWDVDHAGNPLVVGRGVVSACRTGDKAAAGYVYMTGLAYQCYRETRLGHSAPANPCSFSSKDLPDDLEVRVWRVLASEVWRPQVEC